MPRMSSGSCLASPATTLPMAALYVSDGQQARRIREKRDPPPRGSAKASSTKSIIDALAGAEMFLPAEEQTAARAVTTEGAISFSADRTLPTSSVISGSTRGWCFINSPKPAAARARTLCAAGSEADLTNVRVSWGWNGLTSRGTCSSRTVRVWRLIVNCRRAGQGDTRT